MYLPRVLSILSLFLLSTFFATNTLAQRDFDPLAPGSLYEVSGQVRAADNKTVENVMVRIETHSGALVDQTTTDSLGRFRFLRLRSGTYKISAAASAAVAQSQVVDINRSNPRPHLLFEIVPVSPNLTTPARVGVIDVRVPLDAKSAFDKGQAAVAEKKSDAAIAHFKKAIEIYPDFYDAHLALGQLYLDNNQLENAEAGFRQAITVNPKGVRAMVSLGEIYRRQKKYEPAQKVLADALKLDNNSWESNFTLGRIFWELKDIVTSGRYVARTIELQPDLAEAHLLAGNIFVRAGLPANALVEYQEYLRLAPDGEFSEQTKALVEKLKKSLPAK
jgi:tetratricopeptide (TPR) repeat protein